MPDLTIPEFYPLSSGRRTGMLYPDGTEALEGDEVLYCNHPGHAEGLRGVIRRAAWSKQHPAVEDGWVVVGELPSGRWYGAVTAAFSASAHGIRKVGA
jgi:hypothetical protein